MQTLAMVILGLTCGLLGGDNRGALYGGCILDIRIPYRAVRMDGLLGLLACPVLNLRKMGKWPWLALKLSTVSFKRLISLGDFYSSIYLQNSYNFSISPSQVSLKI